MGLPNRASVVVVGGGIVGASVAHHLAKDGVRDLLVLDRAAPGAGSTGAATGGFRAQFATAVNVQLSLLSREKLHSFEEETGFDPWYVQAGYLWLATSEATLGALRFARELQQREGLREAVLVTPEEIARINPAISLEGVVGGSFCPTDGFIRPLSMLDGYRAAAERRGATFAWGVDVTSFRRGAGGRLTHVEAGETVIACDAVVNAAGAWAGQVARLAGVELPVEPLRRQVLPTLPTDALPADMPMTIWTDDGYHLRVRDGRVLLLHPSPGAPGKPFSRSVDPAWAEAVASTTRARVPAIRDVPVDLPHAWAGLYEMSPDRHAILGAAGPECPNLYFANGSSGHGAMHAPALGQLLAEIMQNGRAATLDATPLRPSRFAEGQSLGTSELL